MQTPVQVSFRGTSHSDRVEALCLDEASELERFHEHMTSCHVVVEQPHHRHRKGNVYSVRIDIGLPGAHVLVNRTPGGDREDDTDVMIAVRRAFTAARRQLDERQRKHVHHVKQHDQPTAGRVATLYEDHGFIQTLDGDSVYFHRNAVLEDRFDQLSEEVEVRFVQHDGDKGPQASSVKAVGRHNHIV